jgi:hypothetical protein
MKKPKPREPAIESVTLKRLIEEVRNEKIAAVGYNRVYNRHHRS